MKVKFLIAIAIVYLTIILLYYCIFVPHKIAIESTSI